MKVCPRCGSTHPDDMRSCPFDGKVLEPLQDPFIGRTVGGRYRILEKVGEGGMGCVYRAVHLNIERQVAVKVLSLRLAQDNALRSRFLREARSCNIIRHEHVIEIYELEQTEEGIPYIVMEFLDGKPLNEVLRGKPFSPGRALSISIQVAQALGPAHAMGIIHRDLKPGNVFLVRKGGDPDFVKILDFGLVHLVNEPRLTEKGAVVGTPEYMSPEQAKGKTVVPQSDLYSLGCTMYEMMCGRPPFVGKSIVKLMLSHIDEKPRELSKRSAAVPEDLSAVVMRLLEKQPKDRFQDAYTLLEALKSIKLPESKSESRRRPSGGTRERAAVEQPPSIDVATVRELSTWKRYLRAAKTASDLGAVNESVKAMEKLTNRLEEIEGQVEEMTLLMEEQEQQSRELGRKIRYAIDDLAAELSRRHVEVASRSGKLEEIRGRMSEQEERISSLQARSWGRSMDSESVEWVCEAGRCASLWLELAEDTRREEAISQSLIKEMNDLEFQIESLKSRFEESQAETKKSLARLRKRLERLYAEKTSILDSLSRFSTTFGARIRLDPGVNSL